MWKNLKIWFSTGLFWVYSIGLIMLSFCKSAGIGLAQISAIEAAFGGDKSLHFILSGMLTLLACFASERVLCLRGIKRSVVIFFVLVLVLLFDESTQYLLASRHFELLDFAFGSLGLLTGAMGYLLVRLVWPNNKTV